ncbi:AraC family transcriptional regulator [Accumulibacter sp.]|uniref:AraC family transcriptional regulator n=2 Tax=Accumulibacter sp. TaxID=2053492 RepID=UPI0025FB7713|nr:AraC family transcriptional regulator [Accumulibacter sp.]MCM8626052.1 AraC family transcriptional regulator [Accumulibacter sp.]
MSDQQTRPLWRGEGAVRTGGAIAIPAVLADLGSEPAAVFAEAGVDLRLFDDPDNLIPFAALGRLLRVSVVRTGRSDFGLLVGQRGNLSSLGLVGYLAQHSPDVESALGNVVRYLHHHDRGAVPTMAIEDDRASLGYAIYQAGVEATDQIADGALAIACNMLRTLCGPGWQPVEVRLAHRPPIDAGPYRRTFRCPVLFAAEQNCVLFAAQWLRQPLPAADASLRRILQRQIDELEARDGGDFPAQLRRVLRTALLTNRATAAAVAQLYSMHSRTLNRRLLEFGTTFQKLVDETRHEMARQMLRDSGLTLSEIAAALDYADASAFSRAFARWSGITPGRWRANELRRTTRPGE